MSILEEINVEHFDQISLAHDQDHREELERIDLSQEFFSVILKMEPVCESAYENPDLYDKIPVTHRSRIDSETMSLMMRGNNNRFDWVDRRLSEHYQGKDDKDQREAFDYYMNCLQQSYIPEVIDMLKWEWASTKTNVEEWDEENEDEQLERLIQQNTDEWQAYLQEAFLPQLRNEHKPRYDNFLPHPLCKLAGMSSLCQYYFIKKGDHLAVATGASSGSGTRETHGFYGHLFAEIQKRGVKIPTLVARVDENCQFLIERESDHLILYRHDLTGNYRIDRDESQKILEGIELF